MKELDYLLCKQLQHIKAEMEAALKAVKITKETAKAEEKQR